VKVWAASAETPTWQWHRLGQPIPGATNATLPFPNLQPNQAGSYTVVISNSHGAVTSQPIEVHVTDPAPPFILQQPESVVAYPRQSVEISARVRPGPLPLQLQWLHHGTEIAGATNPVLRLAMIGVDDEGPYTLRVSHVLGSTVSEPAFPNPQS
jgi:hypothetical protein